mgnify:CR=1 FL=1
MVPVKRKAARSRIGESQHVTRVRQQEKEWEADNAEAQRSLRWMIKSRLKPCSYSNRAPKDSRS